MFIIDQNKLALYTTDKSCAVGYVTLDADFNDAATRINGHMRSYCDVILFTYPEYIKCSNIFQCNNTHLNKLSGYKYVFSSVFKEMSPSIEPKDLFIFSPHGDDLQAAVS